ncbi:MAG TPA: carboxypeptidase-like regulatory domain-containing protein, partial [bacterium]
MKRCLIPIVLLAVTTAGAPAYAQSSAQAPGSLSTEKCLIEGRVVHLGTSEPLRRAQVTLTPIVRGAVPMRALTDPDGRFSFLGINPGRYRLVAVRNGYLRQEFGQQAAGRGGTPLELSAGQRRNDILFRMTPWGVISGRVYDEEGEPVVRGNVQVYRSVFLRGRRTLSRVQNAQTNDRGEYRVFGLAPGRYYLSAQYAGSRIFMSPGSTPERVMVVTEMAAAMEASRAGADEAYAPTFYPGTTDPGRAAAVDVGPGAELNGLDFTLTPVPTVRVRGSVVNSAASMPARNVAVWLFPRQSQDRAMMARLRTMVQSTGEFEIRGVVPGSYYLAANWTERGQLFTARQAVEVGAGGLEGVTLFLQPGASLEGTVRIEGGDEGLTETVRVETPEGPREINVRGIRVSLIGADDSPAGNSNTTVRPDGTFNFRNLAPGN